MSGIFVRKKIAALEKSEQALEEMLAAKTLAAAARKAAELGKHKEAGILMKYLTQLHVKYLTQLHVRPKKIKQRRRPEKNQMPEKTSRKTSNKAFVANAFKH